MGEHHVIHNVLWSNELLFIRVVGIAYISVLFIRLVGGPVVCITVWCSCGERRTVWNIMG